MTITGVYGFNILTEDLMTSLFFVLIYPIFINPKSANSLITLSVTKYPSYISFPSIYIYKIKKII